MVVSRQCIDCQLAEPLTGINAGQLRTRAHAPVRELASEVGSVIDITGRCNDWSDGDIFNGLRMGKIAQRYFTDRGMIPLCIAI